MNVDIIDSSKVDSFFFFNTTCCLNLNSYIKNINQIKIKEVDFPLVYSIDKINLCNYASLCYKLNVPYSSIKSIELFKTIIETIRYVNPNIQFVQELVLNALEVDCKPIHHLTEISNNTIFINKIFKDRAKIIGFTDSQIVNTVKKYSDPINLFPLDMLDKIPLETEMSILTYNHLKELMNC